MKKSFVFGLFLIVTSCLQSSEKVNHRTTDSSFFFVQAQLKKLRSRGEIHSCETIIPFAKNDFDRLNDGEKSTSLLAIAVSPKTIRAQAPILDIFSPRVVGTKSLTSTTDKGCA